MYVSKYKADNINNVEELFKKLEIYYEKDIYYQNKLTNCILTERAYYKMLLDDYLDDYFNDIDSCQTAFESMYQYLEWRLLNECLHDWTVFKQ